MLIPFLGLYGLFAAVTANALTLNNPPEEASPPAGAPGTQRNCRNRAIDVVTLLDSSGSMRRNQWETVKEISRHLVDVVQVGKSGSRLSAISFASEVHTHWDLQSDKARKGRLAKEALSNLKFLASSTSTPEALEAALKVFQQSKEREPEKFSDPNRAHMLLLTTDGCANRFGVQFPSAKDHIKDVMKRLRDLLPKIFVLVIAIGNNLCTPEINLIAGCEESAQSCPNAKYTDFGKVITEIPKYFEQVCEEVSNLVEENKEVVDDNKKTEEGEKEEKEEEEKPEEDAQTEGNSTGVAIAGGVIGGIALLALTAGGAYFYTRPKAPTPQAAASAEDEEFAVEDQEHEELLDSGRDVVVEADAGMFA